MNSLTIRILAGLGLGLTLGATLAALHSPLQPMAVDLAGALGGVWLDALRMTIVPLIFALLVVGIGQVAGQGSHGGLAGRALVTFGVTLLIATTLTAILTPLLLQAWPAPAEAAAGLRRAAAGQAETIPPTPAFGEWLKSFVPANPVKAAADGAIASICVFALTFGLAASRLDEARRTSLFGFFDAVQAAMMTIVHWVLWAAPFGVFFLAVTVGAQTGFGAIGVLGHYVVVVSLMCLMAGAIGLGMAVFGGRLPLPKVIAALLPVEAMAISTQSSLSCLPLMLEATEKLGVSERVRGLVLPMAVAVFRLTSPPGNLAVCIYVAHIYGVQLDPGHMVAGVVVASLVSLATVGVASSVTFFTTLVPISMAMGLPLDLLPLLLAVETLPDFSRTIGNVTAHVGVTSWAQRWSKTAA